MDYDPIKDRFGDIVAANPWLTRLFFIILHVVFLRAWYVRRELKRQLEAIRRRNRSRAKSGADDDEPGEASESSEPKIRMLDAGTGFGQFADFVARRYPDVSIDAVDIKEEYLTRAREVFRRSGIGKRVQFTFEDLTHLTKPGPYDLILSVDVMEHILEDEAVFRHFFRVLRPGGVVIINTPSDEGGSDVQEDGGAGFIGEHVRDGYNVEDIAAKLNRAGLETSHIYRTYGRFGSLAWRFMIKWPMQLLHLSWVFVVFLPFYYVITLPLGVLLHVLDIRSPNRSGTGLLVVAEKPIDR